MKKTILFIVLLLWANTFIISQTWHKAYNAPIGSISGGCIVDQNIAWVVGSSQSIYKSSDGGQTWVNKYHYSTTSYTASGICFVNPSTGFVACNYGHILKTTDAGETWVQYKVPDTTYSVLQVYFFDANLGYALCANAKNNYIYKTIDGCATWTVSATITGQYMYNMDFSSPTAGIASGTSSSMYYTKDGNTWQLGTVTGFPPISYSRSDQWGVKFMSATSAASCGWGSTAVGYEPTIFLKTTDGGANWVYQNQADANRTYVNFKSIYFKDALNGFSIGGATYPGTIICKTTDGGTNWIPLPSVAGFNPQIVMGIDNKLIVAGDGGGILLSNDFGDSWSVVNKLPSNLLSSINIINNNIYACGYGGVFFKSTDMGSTFNMSYLVAGNKCLWSKSLYFLNEELGYACSQRGQVAKTTNGGNSWFQALPDTNITVMSNQSVRFINENIGFVVGNYESNIDVIYKTTDGGATWTSKKNQVFQNLNCVDFADDMHGAAVGNKSMILYTTDQGTTWNPATVNTPDQLAINGITFYDKMNGIAVGSGIILKTIDGGATWNRITTAQSFGLSSVTHVEQVLYAAGSKYCLKSTDEGNTWVNIMDTVYAAGNSFTTMNGIAVDKSGYIWICGGGGILTNAPFTAINEKSFEPNSFSLEQNYPNPFNPSTSINFTLTERSIVALKIYDILGKEVRVLYKGDMIAGKHIVNFNAAGLASGTYIYSLQANDKITSRKMILLK